MEMIVEIYGGIEGTREQYEHNCKHISREGEERETDFLNAYEEV